MHTVSLHALLNLSQNRYTVYRCSYEEINVATLAYQAIIYIVPHVICVGGQSRLINKEKYKYINIHEKDQSRTRTERILDQP